MGGVIMKCPIETHENAELLLAYCARKLDPETEAVLERHLAGCAACREWQKSQATVWQALDAWDAMPVSPDFDRRLYRRIEKEQAHGSWWSRLAGPIGSIFGGPRMSRSVPVAAALCLLALAGMILERSREGTSPEDVAERIESIQPDQVERTL